MTHFHTMFVNISFNKEHRILTKNMCLFKGYTAQKLLKEFPSKSWNQQSFHRLLKDLNDNG